MTDRVDRRSLILIFAGLCSLNIIVSLDATALAVSIPTIAADLDATRTQAYWTGTSFVLASAVFQPVVAALADAIGHRVITILVLTIFIAGTIICGTSSSIAQLIAGRTIQGVGGGGLLVATYIVISDTLSLRARGKGFAVISITWLFGTGIGPAIGGAFTAYSTWRWIFWICLPLSVISIALIGVFLRTPHQPVVLKTALKQFDWFGAVLLVGSLTSFLIAISWGGNFFPWSSFRTILPLVIGVVGIVVWVVYEFLVPTTPILRPNTFKSPTATCAFIGTLLMGIVQFGLLFYLPLYYQTVKGYSPLIAGVAILPNCIFSGVASGISGPFIAKTGQYRLVVWFGWACLTLGCFLLLLLNAKTSIPAWIFINIVSGLGLGLLFSGLAIASQAPQEEANKAAASALSPFLRAIGQALGIVLGNTVVTNVRIHGRNNFNEPLHAVWWALSGVSLFGGVISLGIRSLSLDSDAKRGVEQIIETPLQDQCPERVVEDAEKGSPPANSALPTDSSPGQTTRQ